MEGWEFMGSLRSVQMDYFVASDAWMDEYLSNRGS